MVHLKKTITKVTEPKLFLSSPERSATLPRRSGSAVSGTPSAASTALARNPGEQPIMNLN